MDVSLELGDGINRSSDSIYGPLKLKGQFWLTQYWIINFGFGIFEYFSCLTHLINEKNSGH